jgi:hypothetical protein
VNLISAVEPCDRVERTAPRRFTSQHLQNLVPNLSNSFRFILSPPLSESQLPPSPIAAHFDCEYRQVVPSRVRRRPRRFISDLEPAPLIIPA